jgi:capsular exopolysaccharide synthesis family protein
MDELAVVGQTDLREYLHILNRRKLVIALAVVVVLGLALAYSFVKTPIYSASATVLVPQQQASSALNIQNSQLPAAQSLQRSLSDEQQFARGDAVKRAAKSTLGYAPGISVGASSTADVLTFSGHSTGKSAATAIANAYANGYITARRANQVAQYTQQVTALETSIAQLQAKANALAQTDPQRAALQQSVTSLTQTVQQTQAAAQLVTQTGPTVVNAARLPTSPTSPKPVRNGILGFLVGLILGVGLAFLVERLDDGINSREAAEQATEGLPVVGLIPLVDSWRAKGSHHLALVEDPTSNVSEAYRTLRTSIQFLSIDDPKHVIGITSSVPDEGKTTAVANLAVSFARAGQRVIVVSCDLRRPRIHEFFGVDNRIGLTSVLIGQVALSEALQAVEGEPRLRILASGPVPPNPAEILSLDRVREVIDVLADNADVVLLDCPPVLPVTDALLLSRLVDGMLVLAAAKSTSRRDLGRTIQLLHQVQAPVLGTILNRVPAAGGYAYGYGYGSYGRYSYKGDADLEPREVEVPEPGTMTRRRPSDATVSSQAPSTPANGVRAVRATANRSVATSGGFAPVEPSGRSEPMPTASGGHEFRNDSALTLGEVDNGIHSPWGIPLRRPPGENPLSTD